MRLWHSIPANFGSTCHSCLTFRGFLTLLNAQVGSFLKAGLVASGSEHVIPPMPKVGKVCAGDLQGCKMQ